MEEQLQSAAPYVRRAEIGDIPVISELAAQIWRSYYPGIISAAQIDYMLDLFYDPVTLLAEIQQQQIEYWLLYGSGKSGPIGFMSYGPAEGSAIKLHKLYIQPQYHGKGLGSLLLSRAEEECRNRSAAKIRLNVNKNNSKAIRAYERNGFQTVDAVLNDIGSGFFMDDYVMEKELLPFSPDK